MPTLNTMVLSKWQESRRAEEERIRKEKEMDYLAPFLARVGDPPTLDHKQAKEVAETCLQDLRTRLVDMANVIQARFEKVEQQDYVINTHTPTHTTHT